MHDKWLEEKGIKQKNFVVVTWGDWDCRTMLESECKFINIRKPAYFNSFFFLSNLIGLNTPDQRMLLPHPVFLYNPSLNCGLKDAIELAGLTWVGRPHCGLDDARNTAHLLVYLMHSKTLFITYSLTSQTMGFQVKYNESSCDFMVDRNHHTIKPEELTGSHVQIDPFVDHSGKETLTYSNCEVLSRKSVHKPGQT
ncbi:ERI1 exoribonuclease 2-like [Canna indica]|uniref:ERI1 exoribonuclease 2-like n=1 Tax=Canna indica TaxID=4628 RepID=A0AAQ3QM37_9LILI|nr:ERI1 exoribonuclease 2-like [Canna indica]